jgi:hypothetical protein
MCAAEVCGGAGAARPNGAALPLKGSVVLSDKEVSDLCWLVCHVTEFRKGLEGVHYYAAKEYDEEIEGRRKALEAAKALGIHGIRAYLERRGIRPDGVWADARRYGSMGAFRGEIMFYIRLGEVVHVFEEAGDGRGRYLGEFTTEELEESGI